MTLDGVIEAPTWTFEFGFDPQMGESIKKLNDRSRAILLGRNTYEMFEPAWSSRTEEDDPGAPFFNDTHKYVVTSTLTEPTWRNSSILGPYDPDAIGRLKEKSTATCSSAAARCSCAPCSPTASSTSCTSSSSR